jgi:hypothetical protein
MATVTPSYTFTNDEVVTPAKLNSLGVPTVFNIVNADLSATANIALSKLAAGVLPEGITVTSNNMVDGTIVNTDISANAAISGTKVVPNFGAQNISTTGAITAGGDITAFSDIRTKSEVETITSALELVANLRGVRYLKNGKRGIGVIAQEVDAVVPEVVSKDGEYLSVAYGNLVGLLIEAIKELNSKLK